MRNVFITLAAAASALAVASPASAQWAPQQQNYGSQGYGYGQNTRGQVRALDVKVEQIRQRIQRFDRSNRISNREARRLDAHAIELRRRIHYAASRGLHYRERQDIERRIEGLRQAVRYATRENRRWGWNGQNGYDNSFGYYGARVRNDDRRGRDNDDRRDRDDDDRRDDDRRDRDDD